MRAEDIAEVERKMQRDKNERQQRTKPVLADQQRFKPGTAVEASGDSERIAMAQAKEARKKETRQQKIARSHLKWGGPKSKKGGGKGGTLGSDKRAAGAGRGGATKASSSTGIAALAAAGEVIAAPTDAAVLMGDEEEEAMDVEGMAVAKEWEDGGVISETEGEHYDWRKAQRARQNAAQEIPVSDYATFVEFYRARQDAAQEGGEEGMQRRAELRRLAQQPQRGGMEVAVEEEEQRSEVEQSEVEELNEDELRVMRASWQQLWDKMVDNLRRLEGVEGDQLKQVVLEVLQQDCSMTASLRDQGDARGWIESCLAQL